MGKPAVSIIMGSESDLEVVKEAIELLKNFKVAFEVRVLSAHRTPKELASFVEGASRKGVKVFIAAAGGAAALAGVVAAHTILPVIGIPIETKSLKGLDSLLSTVQMPPGIPVASMAIGKTGVKNAALFALQILAVTDKKIASQLFKYRKDMRRKIIRTKIRLWR
jgi:phosphoribosylaminoimidazole carboxylase PurE protein